LITTKDLMLLRECPPITLAFKLDHDKRPYAIAGVPPDYFSQTGQLWGNPVYRWDVLKKRRYDWWEQRIKHNLNLFDFLRVDHFRGFVSYWEVPANAKNAIEGKWVEAPAMDFFDHLRKTFSPLPIVAEDLGFAHRCGGPGCDHAGCTGGYAPL